MARASHLPSGRLLLCSLRWLQQEHAPLGLLGLSGQRSYALTLTSVRLRQSRGTDNPRPWPLAVADMEHAMHSMAECTAITYVYTAGLLPTTLMRAGGYDSAHSTVHILPLLRTAARRAFLHEYAAFRRRAVVTTMSTANRCMSGSLCSLY